MCLPTGYCTRLHGCTRPECRRRLKAYTIWIRTRENREIREPLSEEMVRKLYQFSARHIADASGVSRSTINKARLGRKVRPRTRAALEAFVRDEASPGRAAIVPRRQLQALATQGWSTTALATRCNVSAESIRCVRDGLRVKVTPETAAAIDALYTDLEFTPGKSASVVRKAARAGWFGPGAYDDIRDLNSPPICGADTYGAKVWDRSSFRAKQRRLSLIEENLLHNAS